MIAWVLGAGVPAAYAYESIPFPEDPEASPAPTPLPSPTPVVPVPVLAPSPAPSPVPTPAPVPTPMPSPSPTPSPSPAPAAKPLPVTTTNLPAALMNGSPAHLEPPVEPKPTQVPVSAAVRSAPEKLLVTTNTTVPAPPLPSPPAGIVAPPLALQALAPDARRDFDRAQELVDRGQESEALVSITDFLRRYPEHPLAGNAQFLLGEVTFRQRKFSEALTEFRKVYQFRPSAELQAETGLRVGECFVKLGEPLKARIEWNAVVRRFPKSPASDRARLLLKGLL